MNQDQMNALLFEAYETEKGGVQIYETAIQCAVNDDLKEEWEKYLEQTTNHVAIVEGLLNHFQLDPNEETPGRKIVRHIGESLVQAMKMAIKAGDPDAAQIVAAECVVLAETKDHLNWELIGLLAENLKGANKKVLQEAQEEVEDQEDEHLYHTAGWARELHIDALGLRAALPPPEEEKDVKTAIGAERAKNARKKSLK